MALKNRYGGGGGGKHAVGLNRLLSTGKVKMSLAGVEGYQFSFRYQRQRATASD